jgi:two-component system, chemotaxis family, response regulator Rcp1
VQGRFSLLLVEDNPTDVFLVKEAIAAHGLDIDLNVIDDGEHAIDLIKHMDFEDGAWVPDIVLLDINLPRTDGFDVLQQIRLSKSCAKIPVIVMTSSAAPVDQSQSAVLGATAYFQKPSGYDDFLKIGELILKLLS